MLRARSAALRFFRRDVEGGGFSSSFTWGFSRLNLGAVLGGGGGAGGGLGVLGLLVHIGLFTLPALVGQMLGGLEDLSKTGFPPSVILDLSQRGVGADLRELPGVQEGLGLGGGDSCNIHVG